LNIEIHEEIDLICPFCGEKDFDKIGLKFHLINYCKEYDNIPNIISEYSFK